MYWDWTWLWYGLVGLSAGFVAGLLVRGQSHSRWELDMMIGILGSFIGAYLLRMLQIFPNSLLGDLVSATIGAMLLVGILKLVFRR